MHSSWDLCKCWTLVIDRRHWPTVYLLSRLEPLNTSTASLQSGKTSPRGPVGWGWRIHQLNLCGGVRPHQRVSWHDTEQSDGEVPVMLELWGMQNTPSLPSLPGPLWPRLVAPDRFLSTGQLELNCVLMFNWIAWNRRVLIFKLRTYA